LNFLFSSSILVFLSAASFSKRNSKFGLSS
jgi:hypothetical protein